MKNLSRIVSLLGLSFTLAAAEPETGFKSLFNGKDLSGWEGNPELWSVKDGCLTGKTPPDPADPKKSTLTHNTFLIWKAGTVADFELRCSYKIVPNNDAGFANSGIQYRSKVIDPAGWVVGGYQADFEAAKTYSGILYEEKGRGILAKRGEKVVIKPGDGRKPKIEVTGSLGKSEDIQAMIKAEDWNDYVVIANGNHLQHFINGVQTVDVTDEDTANAAKSGVLALQVHQGPPMTVQFRNIRIKTLSSGAAAKNDLDALQGEWQPIEMVGNGEAAAPGLLSNLKLAVKGKKYFVQAGDNEDSGSFEILAPHQPGQMDVTTQKGEFVPAIYELSGDTLRVCYAINNAPRPTEFKSTAGSDHILAVYQRIQH